MHGAGNDFVVIDNVRQSLTLTPAQIRRLANRQRGVGCDQVLLVGPPGSPDADFSYRIFNADGSEAGQCGNGARCFARFIREQKLSWKRSLTVETPGGLMALEIEEDGRIRANLGCPVFTPAAIPLASDVESLEYRLDLDTGAQLVGALSLGNPHAVLIVDDVAQAPVTSLGPVLEAHPRFPEQANVGFMQVLNRDEIKLRVFERGAGETLRPRPFGALVLHKRVGNSFTKQPWHDSCKCKNYAKKLARFLHLQVLCQVGWHGSCISKRFFNKRE